MPEDDRPDELDIWLQRRFDRVQAMLKPDNPMSAQETFDALTTMAREYLSLAKRIIALVETANRAADSMLEPPDTKRVDE